MAALIRGSAGCALAARTFSRAAPRSMPVRQCNQWAHDRKPLFQPDRASNSRSSTKSSQVAACSRAARAAIVSPRSSVSARRASTSACGETWLTVESTGVAESMSHLAGQFLPSENGACEAIATRSTDRAWGSPLPVQNQRRKQHHWCAGRERRARSGDQHGHQRRVGRHELEFFAVGAPPRRRGPGYSCLPSDHCRVPLFQAKCLNAAEPAEVLDECERARGAAAKRRTRSRRTAPSPLDEP